jgi:hypothetical protein
MLQIENLGKKFGTIDASISNRMQEMEERISGAEDSRENISTTIKENTKCKKILTQNIQEIQDTMIGPNLWIICVDENEDFQPKEDSECQRRLGIHNGSWVPQRPIWKTWMKSTTS